MWRADGKWCLILLHSVFSPYGQVIKLQLADSDYLVSRPTLTSWLFHFYSEIIMSSVLYHFWLFLSGKSQIVNISSLREIINSFCTYSFSVSANWWFSVCYKLQQHSHLKLFYTLKEGEIWEHWLCYLLHILFAYASCCGVYHTLSTNALKSPATTPDTGEGQAWGGAA